MKPQLVSACVIALSLTHPAICSAQIKPQIAPWTIDGHPECNRYFLFRPSETRRVANPKWTMDSGLLGTSTKPSEMELTACLKLLSKDINASQSNAAQRVVNALADAPADKSDDQQGKTPSAAHLPGQQAGASKKADDTGQPTGTLTQSSGEQDAHVALKKIYLAYRNARWWVDDDNRDSNALDARIAVRAAYNELAEHLQTQLEAHGLTQPFAATLITAFAIHSTGSQTLSADAKTAPADTGSTASAAGFVAFESMHFFSAPGRHYDVDVAGLIGFRPTLSLVTPLGNAGANSPLIAQYQQAFNWAVYFEPNFGIADLAELTPIFGLGQTILTTTQSLIENGANSQVGITATNDAAKGAIFDEVGIKLGIYSQSLAMVHLNKGMLTPTFGFAVGLRRDNRFTRTGALQGVPSPEQRVFVRMSTDAIPLQDPNPEDRALTLNFALEDQKPLKGGSFSVPSGTRFLIRGDLNLFKATQAKK